MFARRVILCFLVTSIGATAPGCGDGTERSVEAFCSTFEREAVRLHDKYGAQVRSVDAEADPFGALLVGTGSLLEAQGDFVVLFDRLEKVAPEEIQPEVVALRDNFKRQAEAMGELADNPLGALGGGLISGLQSKGSYGRVEGYLGANCDLSFMGG